MLSVSSGIYITRNKISLAIRIFNHAFSIYVFALITPIDAIYNFILTT